jgi:hypothetical protein
MGLGIYVLDRQGRQKSYFPDDRLGSFIEICESAPRESMRHGVMKYGDTTFNRNQLMILVEELEALGGEKLPIICQVLEAARYARDQSLYLFMRGD